jgi:hypothetical protein
MKNTEKKIAKAKAFEQKQLSSLKAKSARGTSGSYFLILLVIIACNTQHKTAYCD